MSDQARKARDFRELHIPGTPLVLFNVWDAGSAQAVTAAGAKAIATSSLDHIQMDSRTASSYRFPLR